MVICILKKKHDILREKCLRTFNSNFRPEEFRSKNNSTIGKSRKISIYICLLFFLRDSEYDYERVEQSVFCTDNAPRAPSGSFLADAPIYYGHTNVEKWLIFSCFLPILKCLSESEFKIFFNVKKRNSSFYQDLSS